MFLFDVFALLTPYNNTAPPPPSPPPSPSPLSLSLSHPRASQGVDTHPAHVQANDRMVMMTYDSRNGMHLGAVEPFQVENFPFSPYSQHVLISPILTTFFPKLFFFFFFYNSLRSSTRCRTT